MANLLARSAAGRLSEFVRSRRFSSLRPSGGVNPPPYAHRAAKAALFFRRSSRARYSSHREKFSRAPGRNSRAAPAFVLARARHAPRTQQSGGPMKRILIAALAIGVLAASGAAFAQMAPTKMGDSAKGKVLTDAKGMTLYTFDKDMGGKSACNGPCAGNWPPLAAVRRRQVRGRLHDRRARRRRQTVGLQGQAALHLEERPQAGRHHRRRLPQQHLAHRQAVSGRRARKENAALPTRGGVRFREKS